MDLPARRRWPTRCEWLLFVLQVVLVVMVEVGDDILRGNFWRPNPAESMQNARDVAAFEASHGFFVEPALQHFLERSHDLLGVLVTWPDVVDIANNVYAFGHIFITLAVVLWVFVDHRPRFALVRNITFLTNGLALLGYEIFPTAPPRLATGLVYDGRLVHFQDTMRHIIGTGTLNGTPIGYNPFSAMPSLHVAWALIAGVTVFLIARHPLLRLFGLLYPILMVLTVVVTANHFLLDAAGAAVATGLATLLALGIEELKKRGRWIGSGPQSGRPGGTPPSVEQRSAA
jgi:hypothetical protein